MKVEDHEGFVLYAQQNERFKLINETIARGDSTVQQFYEGAVVLITGGTGFLGKQLVEKLFRSCKIKKLYYLLRDNKDSAQKRLQNILKDPVYDYLHENQPDFVSKITPLVGDITLLQLGIDSKLWETVAEEVNVILHSAATINFTEPLKVAALTNVRGTREIVNLAKACKNLRSLVYISTAYSHAIKERSNDWVMEKFYETTLSPDLLIKLAEELDEQKLNEMMPALTHKWPNTYSFTKAIAEELIRTMAADLPVCIVRPAIVLASFREPPGWLDKSSVNGPIGFIMGGCLGVLHTMFGDINMRLDIVPVDLVNNAILVAAQETAARKARSEHEVKIYTVTSTRNSKTVGQFKYFCDYHATQIPTPKLLWAGYVIVTKNLFLFTLLSWLLQNIPAYIADVFLQLSGKKPRAFKLLRKGTAQNMVYTHYLTNEWNFGDSNLMELRNGLSSRDRIIYEMDTGIINGFDYFYMNLFGTRKYILKDGLKDTAYGVKKQFWLHIANVIFLTIYAYVIWKCFSTIYYFSHSVVNIVQQID